MRRILFLLLLPGAPEYLIGDLEEEAHTQSAFWFFRHLLIASAHQSKLLETAAATAFLIGIPLVAILELRRYNLTNIPFRESADFSSFSVILLSLIVAALSAWETHLLSSRWLPVAAATILTLAITTLTDAPQILTAAALLGGSLATLRRRGNTA